MLELTPIGTNMYDVLEIVRTNGWKDVTGGYAQINDRGVPMEELGSVGEPIGEKSIRAIVGEYTKFFKTSVYVWWAFDKDSKLIEIFVRKQTQIF